MLARPARIARSWIPPALLLAALSASVLAAWKAHSAIPIAAVAVVDGRVLSVLPGGPAWEHGIRPGQPVLELSDGERPEDWLLRTSTPDGTKDAGKAAMIGALRATGTATLVALAAALVGIALLLGRPAAAAALGVVSLALARPAMMATGDMAGSSAVALAALAAPAMWLLAWSGRRWPARLAALGALVVGAAWLLLRYGASEDPELARAYDLTAMALTVVTYLLVAIVVLSVAVVAVRSRTGGYDARRLGDVIVVGAAAASVPVAIATNVPFLTIGLAVILLLVVYPFTRHRLGSALDRLVLGDLRARSSVEAIERERQRVSREIHDQPLQELAVVIHRIAGHPGLAAETALLQEVSGHLRGVTMQLHPPILTDLGLGPSLEFIIEDMGRDASVPVRLVVEGSPAARLPAEVELTAFRITQEALTNAVRHSAARSVEVRASIDAAEVVVSVTDDGVGLDGVAVAQALSRGHIGLRSMAERAQLVGGDLRIEDARPGTRVSFRWPA